MTDQCLNQGAAASNVASDPATAVEMALEQITSRYYDPDLHRFDYGAAAVSEQFEMLRDTAATLVDADPERIVEPTNAVPFWINLYNLLTLHIVLAGPIATSVREREDFFTGPYYLVAGQRLTLDAIEHGILRGNARRYMALKPAFPPDDARRHWSFGAVDPRIHFALYTATLSSARLRALSISDADPGLENATHEYLAATVEVDPATGTARLPRMFRWYTGDFGGSIDDALAFVRRRLGDERADALADEDINVEFHPFDWRLNDRHVASG